MNSASRSIEAASRLTVKSALNPVLWTLGIVEIPSITAAMILDETPWWLIVVIFFPLALFGFGFLYLLINDPDKLQSEEYQLQKKQLDIVENKGWGSPLIIQPDELDQGTDPKQIEENSIK